MHLLSVLTKIYLFAYLLLGLNNQYYNYKDKRQLKNARNILKVAELRLTINEINCFRFWLENILHKLFREDKYSLISGEFVMCANLELRRTKPRQPLHQSGNRQLHRQTTIQIQRRSERRVIAQCLSQRPGVILNLHPVQVNPGIWCTFW